MSASADTLVVVLSPSGRSALASLLLVGPRAVEIVEDNFHAASKRQLDEQPQDAILFGRWQAPESGEEIVVCRRDDQSIELQCHGGHAAVQAIVAALVEAGARQIEWQDWIEHAETDPIVAAARIQMAAAPTERTASLLWQQSRGALRRQLDALSAFLLADELAPALAAVDELLAFAPLGLHLTKPWQVVLTGPPNVGKSSLLNALVGYERAIVHTQPGTTRDLVTTRTAFDGWPVELVDTAGVRAAADALESAGIDLAIARIATADLVVQVSDARDDLHASKTDSADRPRLLVRNKVDLLAADRLVMSANVVGCSALTGHGLEELQAAIVRRLVPRAPPLGHGIPFLPRQAAALAAIRDAIERGDTQQALLHLSRQPLAPRASC